MRLFWKLYLGEILSFRCDEIISGGYFNLVLDILKDKKGGTPSTHSNSLKVLKSFQDNLYLMDIWRVLNPQEKRFSWRQNKSEVQ